MEDVTLTETDTDSGEFVLQNPIETKVVSDSENLEENNGVIEAVSGDSINVDGYGASAVLDGTAPSITDADVNGMRDDNTTVRVEFSEPVYGVDAGDFEFTGSATVEQVTPGTASEGYVELTFDREIQTGNADSELVVESGSYSDRAGNDNAGTSEYVDSVELNLDEGMNFVSAPFETGGVGFSALEERGLLDNVDVVWAYDQSSSGEGYWESYDPDADSNELQWFRGGQGYVFVANDSTEIDLRSYTRVADNADSDNVPSVPQTEQIEPGWNLVGHYHEGSQSVVNPNDAFGFGYDQDVGVLGQTDDGSMQYVGEADAGEAYWVFTRDYGLYTPKKSDGGSSTSEMELSATLTDTENGDGIVTNGDTVEVDVDVTDDDGLYSVIVGASQLGADIKNTHLYDKPDDELESGTHTVEFTVSGQDTEEAKVKIPVFAEDVYGEEKTVVKTVELDAVDPTVDNFAPSDGSTVDSISDDEITFDLADGGSGVDTSTLSVSVSDSDEPVELDGAGEGHGAISVSEGTVTIDVTAMDDALAEGEVTVTASVDDIAGNTGQGSATFTLDTTPPSPSLDDVSDQTVQSGTSIDVTYTADSSDVQSVEVAIVDGEEDVVTTVGQTGSGVSTSISAPETEGDYSVEVRATDDAGNTGTSSQTALTVDGTVPSISSFSVDNTAGQTVEVSFNSGEQLSTIEVSGTDDVSETSLSVGDFDESGGSENGFTYTAELSSGTDGTFGATLDAAADAAGNDGADGETDDASVDTTGPSMSLNSPSSGATTSDNQPTITADVTDDGSGVDASTLSVTVADSNSGDNAELDGVGTSQSGVSYDSGTLTIDTSSDGADVTLADGQVDVTVNVDDDDGNSGSLSDSFTVDTTNPTVDSFAPSDGSTVDSISNDEITFEVSDATSSVDTSTLSVTVSDTEGEKLSVTGVDSSDELSYDSSTVTVDVSGVSLADGEVTVSATADDDAGNTGEGSAKFTLDTASPSVSSVAAIDDGDDDEYVSAGDTVSVSADITDETSGVGSVSTDASALGGPSDVTLSQVGDTDTYSGSFEVGASGGITANDGEVSLTVTATDAASNEQTGSDTVTLDTQVDTTGLTASDAGSQNVDVTVESDEQLSALTASLSGAESGSLSIADFTETENDDGTYTYEATYEGSSDGDYTVTLDSASDTNGNSDSSPGFSDTVTIDTSPSMESVTRDEAANTASITFDEDVEGVGNTGGSPADFTFIINPDGDATQADYSVQDANGDAASEWTLELTTHDLTEGDVIQIEATEDNDVTDTDGSDDGLPGGETITVE